MFGGVGIVGRGRLPTNEQTLSSGPFKAVSANERTNPLVGASWGGVCANQRTNVGVGALFVRSRCSQTPPEYAENPRE